MRAVDTNVLVRFLTGDDPGQAAKARAVVEHEPVFISRTVLLETEWVLRRVYAFALPAVLSALRGLAGLSTVTIEDSAMTARAMAWADVGMDFADAMHLAAAHHCEGLLTLDKRFVRAAARIESAPVSAL